MTESKYGKYIVYDAKVLFREGMKPRPPCDPEKQAGRMVLYADDTVIPGAFYLNCALIWKASDEGSQGIVHSHEDYDEYVGFPGSNPDDPNGLGGEVEFWLDDEKLADQELRRLHSQGTSPLSFVFQKGGQADIPFQHNPLGNLWKRPSTGIHWNLTSKFQPFPGMSPG